MGRWALGPEGAGRSEFTSALAGDSQGAWRDVPPEAGRGLRTAVGPVARQDVPPRRAPVAVKRHRENVIAQAPREDGGADGDFRGEGQAAASGSTGNRVIREGIGSSRQVESGFSPRAMSAIEANLASWREHDRLILLTGELGASHEVREEHLRSSLRFARETLDAARNALTQETRRRRSVLNAAQVRETIRALGTEASWNQLLQSHNIVITEDY